MTRIVNALEAKGLVTKRANAEDRRTIDLTATMTGRRLLVKARRRRVGRLTAQIAKLPTGEQETLAAGIEILNELIRSL